MHLTKHLVHIRGVYDIKKLGVLSTTSPEAYSALEATNPILPCRMATLKK